MFGAIGDKSRLEHTVVGDAVDLAAKLEKHTMVEAATAPAKAPTHELALAQGFGRRRNTIGAGIATPTASLIL